jgi:hypothetical protein
MLHVSAVYSAILRPIQTLQNTEVYSMGSHFVYIKDKSSIIGSKKPYVGKNLYTIDSKMFK